MGGKHLWRFAFPYMDAVRGLASDRSQGRCSTTLSHGLSALCVNIRWKSTTEVARRWEVWKHGSEHMLHDLTALHCLYIELQVMGSLGLFWGSCSSIRW